MTVEIAQHLRTVALTEDLGLTPTLSSSRGSNALLWPLRALHMCATQTLGKTHTHIIKISKTSKKCCERLNYLININYRKV